jgi:hypothetical protein
MENFYNYRSKRKDFSKGKSMCTQSSCTQDDLLKLRISGDMKTKIMNLAKEKNMSASEMTRLLWENYFKKKKDKAWQKEVEGWT